MVKEVPYQPAKEGQVCTSCGEPVQPGAKFCGSCGGPIRVTEGQEYPLCPRCGAPMKLGVCLVCNIAIVVKDDPPSGMCPHCGSPVGRLAKFCRSCGEKVV